MIVELLTPPKFFVVEQYWLDGKWDGVNWITLSEIEFSVDGQRFKIRSGFVTDFASIPALAHVTINRIGRACIGYVVHDWLRNDAQQEMSTKDADRALYEFMRLLGESWYTSNKVYYALRGFGWITKVGKNEFDTVDPKVLEHINKSNFYVRGKTDVKRE